jgi:hypothetical protein
VARPAALERLGEMCPKLDVEREECGVDGV